MEIIYLGHSSFLLKGKEASVITDPYGIEIGKFPKVSADIVTLSHDHTNHNNAAAVTGTGRRPEPFIIKGPGEYEISDISIFGYPTFHDKVKGKERGPNTIYTILIDNLRLLHLGDLGEPLSEELIAELNGVDVLFIHAGSDKALSSKEAVALVAKIEPTYTIPMHYQSVDDFLLELKGEKITPVDKLVLSYDKLPEESRVVVLNAKR